MPTLVAQTAHLLVFFLFNTFIVVTNASNLNEINDTSNSWETTFSSDSWGRDADGEWHVLTAGTSLLALSTVNFVDASTHFAIEWTYSVQFDGNSTWQSLALGIYNGIERTRCEGYLIEIAKPDPSSWDTYLYIWKVNEGPLAPQLYVAFAVQNQVPQTLTIHVRNGKQIEIIDILGNQQLMYTDSNPHSVLDGGQNLGYIGFYAEQVAATVSSLFVSGEKINAVAMNVFNCDAVTTLHPLTSQPTARPSPAPTSSQPSTIAITQATESPSVEPTTPPTGQPTAISQYPPSTRSTAVQQTLSTPETTVFSLPTTTMDYISLTERSTHAPPTSSTSLRYDNTISTEETEEEAQQPSASTSPTLSWLLWVVIGLGILGVFICCVFAGVVYRWREQNKRARVRGNASPANAQQLPPPQGREVAQKIARTGSVSIRSQSLSPAQVVVANDDEQKKQGEDDVELEMANKEDAKWDQFVYDPNSNYKPEGARASIVTPGRNVNREIVVDDKSDNKNTTTNTDGGDVDDIYMLDRAKNNRQTAEKANKDELTLFM